MTALPRLLHLGRWPSWTAAALLLSLSGLRLPGAAPPGPDVNLSVKRDQTETKDQDVKKKKIKKVGESKKGHYLVTLQNNGQAPVTVDLHYIIYTRTTSLQNRTSTSSLHAADNQTSVALAAGESKTVDTHKIGVHTTEKETKRGKELAESKKEIEGIWVEAEVGGAVVAQYEDPPSIKETMAAKGVKDDDDKDDNTFGEQ
jgi:hypothetical protein